MMERDVPVRVVHEVCKKCIYFEIEQSGVMLFDAIRGLTIFDPHCKHEIICKNLLNLLEGKEQ